MVHEYTRVPIGRDVCKRGNPPDPVTSASCPHIHWGRWCWWSSVHSTPAWNQIRQHGGVWVKFIWAFRLFLFLLFEIQTLNAMQCEWIASLLNKTIIGDETFARVTVSRHFTKLFDILRAGCQRLKVVVSRFHQSEEERSLAWVGEAEYKESGPAFILHSSLRGLGTTFLFEATPVDIIPISAPMNSLPFLSSLLLVSVSAGELLKQHFKTSISC